MHNEDTARFLQREGGDTFCFINTRDVKTLIETTKYSPKIDKTFQKTYVKLSFCHISIFYDFVTGFSPVTMETVNQSHSLYFVITMFFFFFVYIPVISKQSIVLCFPLAIALVSCTTMHFERLSHHAFRNLMAGSAILEI